MSADANHHPPPRVPNHELIRVIGRGSYGEIWMARSELGIMRAVKIVDRTTFHSEKAFQREFEGMAKFEPISRSHDGFIDILHVGRPQTGNWALLAAVSSTGSAECLHSDYLFQNLRIEEPGTLFVVKWPQATFRNIRFIDLQFTNGIGAGILRAKADGINFHNVHIKGQLAETLKDLSLTNEGEMKGLGFGDPQK